MTEPVIEHFKSDAFFKTAHHLQNVLEKERELLEGKDYDALPNVWHDKAIAFQSYAHQSSLFEHTGPDDGFDRTCFQQTNQSILNTAQTNDTHLRQLHDLSTLILTLVTESVRIEEVLPYGPHGTLQTGKQGVVPLKTNDYF